METLYSVLPLLMIAAVFFLFVIRPMQRQRKQVDTLQSALKVGDRVMLTSGIYGVLSDLSEDRAHVVIASGVEVEIARGAIAAVDAVSLAEHDDASAAELPTTDEK